MRCSALNWSIQKTFLSLFLFSFTVQGQSVDGKVSQATACIQPFATITNQIDTLRRNLSIEKVYLQTDKPYYSAGDTIWFKAYLFNQAYLTASSQSELLYVELTSDSNIVAKKMVVSLQNGLGWGTITLDENDVTEGGYTLRGYTNWMRNFGHDYVFSKRFYISRVKNQSWLAGLKSRYSNNHVQAGISLSNLDKQGIGLRELQLSVVQNKRTLFRDKLDTDVSGKLDFGFDLAEKTSTKNLSVVIQDLRKGEGNRRLSIPIEINRPENTDLQFMPEGGNLVAGIPSKVGFKAINENGKGVSVKGTIVDGKNATIVSFQSLFNGIGSINLMPVAGEKYFALLTLSDGKTKSFPLPEVKASGTALVVNSDSNTDSLALTVSASADVQSPNSIYYLIGQSRGVVCYTAEVTLVSKPLKISIAKSLFPSGIARFTLLNAGRIALNERIVFIDHDDNLRITVNHDQPAYGIRDSIPLQIQVNDAQGNPVKGSFSLSVTDDAQVKTDSVSNPNIVSYLLLNADLKGTVEEPGHYFNKQNPQRNLALDNLMLTQGWIGYDWKDVFNPSPAKFQPEKEFMIKGNVSNVFNKAIEGSKITLLSKSPPFVLSAETDKQGRFVFKNIPPTDTAAYTMQAFNRNGKSFNIGIKLDENPPFMFPPSSETMLPWYVNTDTARFRTVSNLVAFRKQAEKITGKNVLNEVTVTGKKIIKDSKNLNGAGNADQILDEVAIEKAGKKSLYDLLGEQLKGFRISTLNPFPNSLARKLSLWSFLNDINYKLNINLQKGTTFPWFFISYKPIRFIVDGISSGAAFAVSGLNEGSSLPLNPNGALQDYINYFKFVSAEDIKGIEVLTSDKYCERYIPIYWKRLFSANDVAFIEITTRSGKGPNGLHNTPGVYVHKPLAPALPKHFYRPNYIVKDFTLPDLRSTIHWEPNIVTDDGGMATFSFYAADHAGTYSVIVEGSDMNGNVGSAKGKITIKK